MAKALTVCPKTEAEKFPRLYAKSFHFCTETTSNREDKRSIPRSSW
jgi:hypothetical protein